LDEVDSRNKCNLILKLGKKYNLRSNLSNWRATYQSLAKSAKPSQKIKKIIIEWSISKTIK